MYEHQKIVFAYILKKIQAFVYVCFCIKEKYVSMFECMPKVTLYLPD